MTAATFAAISRLGPVVRTGEVAAVLRTSLSQASRSLRQLERSGLVRKVRRGTWVVGTGVIDPQLLADAITRPYPAYVSFTSALRTHGMIDQIPRDITLASLDKARHVRTPFGSFAIRHLPPELFGGWEERDGVKVARPEKALFDVAYASAVHLGRPQHIPELELPRGFRRAEINEWVRRIPSARARTLTKRAIDEMLGRASR
jgi:predicted transcriptional regulator of viral defense system